MVMNGCRCVREEGIHGYDDDDDEAAGLGIVHTKVTTGKTIGGLFDYEVVKKQTFKTEPPMELTALCTYTLVVDNLSTWIDR